jgi:hypothetical protein
MARRLTSVRPIGRGRVKISTTVAPDTRAFLQQLIARGEASSLADAIDLVVGHQQASERRAAIEQQMAEYYEGLSDDELREQTSWGAFAEREMFGSDAP